MLPHKGPKQICDFTCVPLKRWSNGDDLNRELEKLQQGTAFHFTLPSCVCVSLCLDHFRMPFRDMFLDDFMELYGVKNQPEGPPTYSSG